MFQPHSQNGTGKNKPSIDVCFSPAMLDLYKKEESIVVVIDILRASSSICVAFSHGVKSIVPVSTIKEALAYKEKGYLIGAEREGEMLEGFDFGNSPFSYMEPRIKGSNIALTTTNGTRALNAAKGAQKIVVGSFLNINLLTQWLIDQHKNIILLCSGWRNTFNLEDTLFAGAMIYKLKKTFDFSERRDSCIASEYLYMLAKNDLYKFLEESSHRLRLQKLHIENDIRYCLTPNQAAVIPLLQDHALYNADILQPV